jgi:hypothetical protein
LPISTAHSTQPTTASKSRAAQQITEQQPEIVDALIARWIGRAIHYGEV